MSENKKYEIIPIRRQIEGEKLLDDVIIYLYSRLKECQIEKNINGNTYTILVSTISKGKENKKAYITVELIVHSDSCAVYFSSSKARPIFNMSFAIATVVAVPTALPASGLLMGSGLLRLWNHKQFKKGVIKYIQMYVS